MTTDTPSDLVKRLRDEAKRLWPHPDFNEKGERLGYHPTAVLHEKSADRIEQLERELARTLERELAGCRHAANTYISRIAELKSELAEARIPPSISPKWRIAELERERDGWKEREAQAHRLLDIAERESAENRRQADGYYHEAAEGWSKFRAAERELAALREAMKRRGKSMVPEMIALRQELAEAQQDAARWKTVDAMWWAGQIEFDCDDNGRCRIQWEPAESPDRVYLGGSPDAAIDAARKP